MTDADRKAADRARKRQKTLARAAHGSVTGPPACVNGHPPEWRCRSAAGRSYCQLCRIESDTKYQEKEKARSKWSNT